MILKEELATNYFNANDLNLLMDISLREVTAQPDSNTRVEVYKLIETILDN
jgi:hypothetical protein